MNTRVETQREEIDFLNGLENTHETQECNWRIFKINQLHIPGAILNNSTRINNVPASSQ